VILRRRTPVLFTNGLAYEGGEIFIRHSPGGGLDSGRSPGRRIAEFAPSRHDTVCVGGQVVV
jgi:hypothetical protein